MALERYRQKRNFKLTPEPAGKEGERRSSELSFVIQKHAARRMHYDFRLELNGVLLSWAVPKGPSLDPNDKRLAMHVEDHPLEYGDFEGVIPPKQYGAGTVMLWDRGTWTPKSDPDQGYRKGHLKFDLEGDKLHGGWNLVKSRSGQYGENSWLLIKEADDFARLGREAQITDDRPDSVLSGRSMEEISVDKDRVWHSNRSVATNVKGGAVGKRKAIGGLARIKGAKKAALPEKMEAQLATAVKSPPTGPSWVHEIKYDGYRMLCRIADGEAKLVSRNGKDWTGDFPTLARALARLSLRSAWLDGEVVATDDKGRTSFQRLQNALDARRTQNLAYLAFDLLYVDGYDLREAALSERKRTLLRLLESAPATIRYSEHFAVPGADFLHHVGQLGLEGMVSKRADLPYRGGRSPAWQKTKCLRRQEVVVGGFTDPEGSRHGFGALLTGLYEADGRLTYCGKVGSGFDDATLARLTSELMRLAEKASPFHNPPQGAEARRAHWVKPALVAEVSFTEWTDDGTMRHPVFLGLRRDKTARQVVRELTGDSAAAASPSPPPRAATAEAKNTVAGAILTHPEKVFYPELKLTKRQLASYYQAVGERMLPHVIDRPLTLMRCPNGWNKPCFYQKNADDSAQPSISRIDIANDDGGTSQYMMANSVTAIVALLQMGALEIHPWGSRAGHLGTPDRIIFDFDPEESVTWKEIREAAHVLRTLLENIGLAAFLKTTGGKGLHVVSPIRPTVGWHHVKGFTQAVAELLERTFPDRFTAKLLKVSRRGKIFIDYLRNAEGATAVGAYSTRARENAPVSMPIDWDELARDVRFDHFNVGNVPKRLARMKSDPWGDMERSAITLDKAIMARVGYKP